MKLRTHIGFGLFFGSLLYFIGFPGFGVGSFFLAGLAGYLPDIDWLTRYMGWTNHRTYGHNIWFMIILGVAGAIVFQNISAFLAVVVGIFSHLVADSLTVTGVWWLWPKGYNEDKYHIKGPINMSDQSEPHLENIIGSAVLGLAGYFFLTKDMSYQLFSIEGLVTFVLITVIGFMLFSLFDRMFVDIIRSGESPIKKMKGKKK